MISKTLEELREETIDSRDLIEAMNYWQSEVNICDGEELKEAKENLKELKEFCEPFECYSDWEYGETLISEDYWVEYVEEMLKDTGYISPDMPSWLEIDWEKTADNLSEYYIYDNDYYMRSA
jgi:hypothetical protein